MKVYFLLALGLLGLLAGQSACSGGSQKLSDSAYVAGIVAERKQKDNEFAANPKSPFASLTEDFTGLQYFTPDPLWRVAVSWTNPDTAYLRIVPDSKGGERKYQYAGDFRFGIAGTAMKLPVWKDPEDSTILFIMFRDKTNGKETYGGGRYIEMPVPERGTDIFLDFNRAFNPYCHYNHNYSCPLVPKDCALQTAVIAGEKLYGKE
jgi:uncharacterized protein (DUF1684 family)